MDRLTLSQTRVDELRTTLQAALPDYAEPAPGSVLKLDDDVMWLEFAPMRIVWGSDTADYFYGYSPDIFGESYIQVDAPNITDRAPADSGEAPMPIYPEPEMQMQQATDDGNAAARQMGGAAARKPKGAAEDPKKLVQAVLRQLPPDEAKRAREKIRAVRPDLLTGRGE